MSRPRGERQGRSNLAETGVTAKTYLEPREVESLEQAATNLRDRLLISLLFRSAPRVSEALAIGLARSFRAI